MAWDLIGHDWHVSLLQQQVRRGNLRHAYLFAGPASVGRRTLALRLAQALNCSSPLSPVDPCRSCRTCKQIEAMQHADLAVVQANSPSGKLQVDQVRQLQHWCSLAPYASPYRLAVLLNFEAATLSAANAMLKTLEEPFPHVILVVTAGSPESLLPTIVSRCELVRLQPVPVEEIQVELQQRWELSPEQARLYAHLSDGRPGLALRYLQDPGLMERRLAWLEEGERLMAAGWVQRFRFADSIYKDKDSLIQLLLAWLSFWRDVLLRASASSAPLVNLDRLAEVERTAAAVGFQRARAVVEALIRTLDLLRTTNVNARLAVEVLMLDLPRLKA